MEVNVKPIILITSYHVGKKELLGDKIRGSRGQELSICTCDYINAVRKAGGVPVVAPVTGDEEEIDALIELADGVLFSGGEDVHPKYYNEVISVSNMKIINRRDEFEIKLARKILEDSRPVLGICRGMQVLNVAAGGTLYQDIDTYVDTDVSHSNPGFFKWDISHYVNIEKNTRLYDIYRNEKNAVNSFHHQAVREAAERFRVSAWAEDGIIEGMELESDRFFVMVQWHPEMMQDKFEDELEIFRHFVKSAEDYKNKRNCEV